MKFQNTTKIHGAWYRDACAAAFAMELIGERWTLLIVRELMLGGRRFSDIRASLPGMSARVLTERLQRMAQLDILGKRRLPPPAASWIYELTRWGYELEPVLQALGRWSVRSPMHDPSLPLTPVSLMLSLRTMMVPGKARGTVPEVLFEIADERFRAALANGLLDIQRDDGSQRPADVIFRAASSAPMLGLFYGKRPPAECGVTILGDRRAAQRFIDLFALPAKTALQE